MLCFRSVSLGRALPGTVHHITDVWQLCPPVLLTMGTLCCPCCVSSFSSWTCSSRNITQLAIPSWLSGYPSSLFLPSPSPDSSSPTARSCFSSLLTSCPHQPQPQAVPAERDITRRGGLRWPNVFPVPHLNKINRKRKMLGLRIIYKYGIYFKLD